MAKQTSMTLSPVTLEAFKKAKASYDEKLKKTGAKTTNDSFLMFLVDSFTSNS